MIDVNDDMIYDVIKDYKINNFCCNLKLYFMECLYTQ